MIARKLIIFGLLFVLLSIVFGAMGAHYIEKIGVDSQGLKTFDTGVRYMFYNGIGMLVIAALSDRFDFTLKSNYRAILWGTVFFSFSIFLLVLLPVMGVELNKFIGPITPIGGLIMIFGWFSLLVKYIRAADNS